MDNERWERLKNREIGRAVELCERRLWQPKATIPEQIHQLERQAIANLIADVSVLERRMTELDGLPAAKEKTQG